MPEAAPGQPTIRVFLSSTFRDLQAEREYLIKRVFPELRQTCRERGVEFTEIDLRWGIPEEAAKQGKVLRLCLEEIDRCRPYFIGIIGKRYGWTPQPEDLKRDPQLCEKFPWVARATGEGRSVTEMEIWHGVLRSPAATDHAYFYFQELSEKDRQELGPDASRVEELRQQVRQSGRPVRGGFADPAMLGQWVREDLLALIERLHPADQAPDPLEQQSRGHEAFAFSRRRFYVPDPATFARLDEHAATPGPPLVVVGESGAGKSALLAAWARDYQTRHPNTFLVAHFVGATAASGDPVGWMRRVMAEVRRRYQWPDEVPADPERVRREFPGWLARADAGPVLLIVDALDQLEPPHTTLAWLPDQFPANVRVFLSAGGPSLDTLRQRSWPELPVPPLNPAGRRLLIRSFLGAHSKALTKVQAERIAAQPASANPLFLLTLLEEIRVFGSFEQLDARLDHYLAAAGLDDLFARVLGRLEGDYGADKVRELMTLLWAARHGLAEAELLEVAALTRLDLSAMLFALDYHLLRREGLLAPSHDHLRQAIRSRYLAGVEVQAHGRLARYFDAQPPAPRRLDELPWQWRRAGEWERLKDCIANVPTFLALFADEKRTELLGYWQALAGRYDPVQTYLDSLRRYREEVVRGNPFAALKAALGKSALLLRMGGLETPAESRSEYAAMQLGAFFLICGHYDAADRLLDHTLENLDKLVGVDQGLIADSLRYQAEARRSRGDYPRAESALRSAVSLRERGGSADVRGLVLTLGQLGGVLSDQGKFADAAAVGRRAAELAERALGPDDPITADGLHTLAYAHLNLGDFPEAERLFRRALVGLERRYGADHLSTAAAVKGLASALQNQGEFGRAEPLYRRCLATWLAHLGKFHLYTAQGWNDLALVLQRQGDAGAAEPLYRESIAAYERAVGPDHPYTATPVHNLAGLHLEAGRVDTARALFERALVIRERVQPGHFVTATTLAGLAMVYLAQGDDDRGASLFRAAVEMMSAAAPGHPATVDGLVNLATLLANRAEWESAKAYGKQAVVTGERSLGPQHPVTRRAQQLLSALEQAEKKG